MSDVEMALETLDEICHQHDRYDELLKPLLDKIRQALQSQAEKDRVMKLMADKLNAIKLQTNFFTQDGIGENVAKCVLSQIDILAEQALAEHLKLGGTQDE